MLAGVLCCSLLFQASLFSSAAVHPQSTLLRKVLYVNSTCIGAGGPVFPSFDRWLLKRFNVPVTANSICLGEWFISTVDGELSTGEEEGSVSAFSVQLKLRRRRRASRHRRAQSNDGDQWSGFSKSRYEVSVLEEQDPPISLLNFAQLSSAANVETVSSCSVTGAGNVQSQNLFTVEKETGRLITTGRLDREQADKHTLRITCYEMTSNGRRSTTAIVLVNVLDLNDHEPVFERSNYAASISESVEPGTTVLHVHAQDEDAGRNGRIQYSVQRTNPETPLPFSLGSDDGVLRVEKPLDRETCPFYRFEVLACDQPLTITERLCAKALVEVTVDDENDNAPEFEQSTYVVEIDENLDPNDKPVIANVMARDRDFGHNGEVKYSIVSGNAEGRFSIDYNTGEVRLVDRVDYRQTDHYELVIRAQDSAIFSLSNTTLLEIRIRDVNDHAPQFYAPVFQESVREDVPVGYRLLRLAAYDLDSGRNSEIRFRFTGPEANNCPLEVDSVTGWVTVAKPLDHELEPTIELQVEAVDLGNPPLASNAKLIVNVLDVDDNVPVFPEKQLNVSVPETARRGSLLLRIAAHDPDNNSGRLQYSIISGNDDRAFILLNEENNYCSLAVDQPLSYTSKPIHVLSIKVTDSAGHWDTMTVRVQVEDVNSAPTFAEHSSTIHVRESEPVGSTVTVVRATDSDDGENARLQYQLEGGEPVFAIEPSTGVLFVNGTLDRESQSRFKLKVIATDHGQPPLSGSMDLEVVLDDVNDNAPVFSRTRYVTNVSEDAAVGVSLLHLTATDSDYGINSRITYHFSDEDPENDAFQIDPSSGVVRVARPLDRERRAVYEITVLAKDKGEPPLIGRTTLVINVDDVNDNAPKFDREAYQFEVYENVPIGTIVGHVLAVDPDVGEHALVSYKILGGDDAAAFEIHSPMSKSEGMDLVTRIELDFESDRRTYQFHIQASSGQLSSMAEVLVRILDLNDHEPVFNDFYLVVYNHESDPWNKDLSKRPIGRVPAFDLDLNDTLHYKIAAGNEADLIQLDSNTGELRLSAALNTNRRIRLLLLIQVSDGINAVQATCTVIVEMITNSALLNSVTFRISGLTMNSFLNPTAYGRLLDSLSALIPSDRRDVLIFSVRQDNELHGEPTLNVSLVLRKANSDRFLSGEELHELVDFNRKRLSEASNLNILPLADELCSREPCLNNERCRNVLKFDGTGDFIVTENFIFKPVHCISTFICECPIGFAELSKQRPGCNIEINLCYSSPCKAGGTCLSRENGYSCICRPDFTGKNCEFPISNSYCIADICHGGSLCTLVQGKQKCQNCTYDADSTNEYCELTTRTFQPNSFVEFPTLNQRNRFNITFQFTTTVLDGMLFYAGRQKAENDFIVLELANGRLKLSMSLGESDIKVLNLDSDYTLNDGQWHKVQVIYFNRTVTLILDDCDPYLALNPNRIFRYSQCAAHMELKLDEKCNDPMVPCYRFLDITSPLYLGGLPSRNRHQRFRIMPVGFVGCMGHLYIDYKMINLNHYISNQMTVPGCAAMTKNCRRNPCQRNSACQGIWEDYICKCPTDYAGKNCSDYVGKPISLPTSSSSVSFKVPPHAEIPLVFGIQFRTAQTDADIVVVELTSGKKIILQITDQLASVTLERKHQQLAQRLVSDSKWHSLLCEMQNDQIILNVDYVYQLTIPLSEKLNGIVKKIKINISSSKNNNNHNHPSNPFTGCLKGAFVDKPMQNKKAYLQILHQKNIIKQCTLPDNFCPKRDADGYCMNLCTLHPCLNGGTCNDQWNSYVCQCVENFTGRNCEHRLSTIGGRCPKGWWGNSTCGPCNCDTTKGYDANCDKYTGICKCTDKTYFDDEKKQCTPCNCFYPAGALNMSCNSETGQCHCRGNAVGKRCDICADPRAQISRISGYCEIVTNGCPENWMSDILWPAMKSNRTSTKPCPRGWQGRATRYCNEKGFWGKPRLENCTTDEFQTLENKIKDLQSNFKIDPIIITAVAEKLKNATQRKSLYGHDLFAVGRILLKILTLELSDQHALPVAYQHDRNFASNIIASLDEAFSVNIRQNAGDADGQFLEQTLELVNQFHDYGIKIAAYQQKSHVDSMEYTGKSVVYAIQTVDLKNSDFQRTATLGRSKKSVAIQLDIQPEVKDLHKARTLFYAVYENAYDAELQRLSPSFAKCNVHNIHSPLLSVGVIDNAGKQVISIKKPAFFTFPLPSWMKNNYLIPFCMFWNAKNTYDDDDESEPKWNTQGCYVDYFNRSHVICACNHLSTFAVSMRDFMTTDTVLSYFALTVTTLSMVIILTVFVCLIFTKQRENVFRNASMLISIFCYGISILLFDMFSRASNFVLKCSVIGNALLFVNVALFTWLVVVPVEIFKTSTPLKQTNNYHTWLRHMLIWSKEHTIPTVYVAIRILKDSFKATHEECWFSFYDPTLIFFAAPVVVLMLLSLYASTMALIFDCKHKQKLFPNGSKNRLYIFICFQLGIVAQWWFSYFAFNLTSYGLYYTYYGMSLVNMPLGAFLIFSIIVINTQTSRKANQCNTKQTADADLWLSMNVSQFEMSMKQSTVSDACCAEESTEMDRLMITTVDGHEIHQFSCEDMKLQNLNHDEKIYWKKAYSEQQPLDSSRVYLLEKVCNSENSQRYPENSWPKLPTQTQGYNSPRGRPVALITGTNRSQMDGLPSRRPSIGRSPTSPSSGQISPAILSSPIKVLQYGTSAHNSPVLEIGEKLDR
ncbi:Protocadherin-like wing polarity protein stan [Trichinella sp. T8]|nr:Protocadherin-like wing polarity protein stan [Trichinella sp. T8]